MASLRPLVLAASCSLPITLAACGGSDGGGTIVPEGTHYGFVVDKISLPASNVDTRNYGLDLGAPKSNKPDGIIDNQLGGALAALIGFKFPIQPTIDAAVDQGSIVLLVDFQTKDFASAAAAGLNVKLGDTAAGKIMPAPCTAGSTTDCRKHLAGTGTFSVAAGSPSNAALAGKIVGGKFSGGPGDVNLQIALGSATSPLTLSLLSARATATGISDSGIDIVVGGALPQADLVGQILPAVNTQITPIIARDCNALTMPDACGCTAGSTGELILTMFDGTDGTKKDCKVTVAEIMKSPLVSTLLAPDVCASASCAAADSVSIGIKVHAVKASFPL